MPGTVLVGYASRYGSTREVAEAITTVLRETGDEVDLQPLQAVKSLAGYQAVVMGSPLFMFHLHKHLHSFLKRHQQALMERPTAVFALGPVHAPFDKAEWLSSHEQLQKELALYPWFKPAAVELFGGKYDPGSLRWPLKMFAGSEPASDIRDWKAIRLWAESLPELLNLKQFREE